MQHCLDIKRRPTSHVPKSNIIITSYLHRYLLSGANRSLIDLHDDLPYRVTGQIEMHFWYL